MKLPALILLAAALLLPKGASAQAHDQARLVINVSAGFMGGASLWQVNRQPLYDESGGEPLIDSLTIRRRIRSSVVVGARGIYFRGDHLGFFGEAFLLGLGFRDSCGRTYATASSRNAEVCSSINGSETASSAVQVAGGTIYRIASQRAISPYVRASVGLAIASRSAILTNGVFTSAADNDELVEVNVFSDAGRSQLYFAGGLGAGFTAQIAPSYQLRWEVRDNMVRMPSITGPTVQDGNPPVVESRVRHLFSMNIGFDVVLERRHGRRY